MKNNLNLKYAIRDALQKFDREPLAEAAITLFETLGYKSEKSFDLRPNNAKQFQIEFDSLGRFNSGKALVETWTSVDLLFQITDEEIREALGGQRSMFAGGKIDGTIINSYLFFAIGLKQREKPYTRGELASITREINKLFVMPVMILFRHSETVSIAVIRRRLNKRDESRDVLEKVTLIKDICTSNPNRAHQDILADLALPELYERYRFINFLELHQAWQDTLNISELNKRFYKDLANWYFWAVGQVKFPDGAGADEPTRNAVSVIRLITRLIFVWFIKEKGLVPGVLFEKSRVDELLVYQDAQSSTYYKAILQNLFFATLNTEMGAERRFVNEDTFHGRNKEYLDFSRYRYKRYFKNPDAALDLFSNIPFLNGGLFECLDKEIEDNDKNQVIRIDGFSGHPDNPLRVPDHLFFSPVLDVDLNAIYDTRNKHYDVCGLIDLLQRYKFTIEENTPIEEEVALDPELLGKVFENLLASYIPETDVTARKQTGSFYTPREIVNYMVDEVLIQHLATQLPEENRIQERLRHLFAYGGDEPLFDDREKSLLITAIDKLKVLDPACGSGAFPMGVLHKLVYVLKRLDQDNFQWREIQKQKAIHETQDAYEIGDHDERRSSLLEIDETFKNNLDDYGRKLFLIENCIYGVDIQPIAIQISKLRVFISLVVDQKVDPTLENLGIRPLPNLETKFIAANSLIGAPHSQQLTLHDPAVDLTEKQLEKLRGRLFRARDREKKRKLREQSKILRNQLARLLEADGWGSQTAAHLSAWDPFDQNTAADFFDPKWMFNLPDGFDVVIGNPPYLRVQGIQKTQSAFMSYYREHFDAASGNFDLYALFIEKGYKLLAKDGQLAYIVPHKFFQAAFGKGLREMLTAHKALRQIVRFGAEQVFEESTTYTCLLFLSVHTNEQFDLIEVKSLKRGEEVLQAVRERIEHPDYVFDILREPTQVDSWDFTIGEHSRILNRLKQHKQTLGGVTRKIFVGLQTSADKIYVLELLKDKGSTVLCYSKYLEREIELEKGFVKPFLMGKDVHRYEPVTPKNVVVFPYQIIKNQAELLTQKFIRQNYPLGWKYLSECKNYLVERESGRFEDNWHAYGRPQNLNEFLAIKIITPDICNGPEMSIDLSGNLYHTTTLYSFVFKKTQANVMFYLGLLNSRIMWYFLSLTGTVLRNGYLRFKTEYLRPFPIAESTPNQELLINTLVDYVLVLRALPLPANRDKEIERRLMIAYFEQLIDGLVYELYFPEEFGDAGKSLFKELIHVEIPVLSRISGPQESILRGIFEKLYDVQHPVRQMIYFLDTIETVRIIEEKTKKA